MKYNLKSMRIQSWLVTCSLETQGHLCETVISGQSSKEDSKLQKPRKPKAGLAQVSLHPAGAVSKG